MKGKSWIAVAVISLCVGVLGTWGIQKWSDDHNQSNWMDECRYEFKRREGFEYIKPIQFVEANCESAVYQHLKLQLEKKVDSLTADGAVKDISVYIRDFEFSGWMEINADKKYHPGSLLKLGALFNILQQAERDTSLLHKKIAYVPTTEKIPTQTYCTRTIQAHSSYTVEELLHYMIASSDNMATSALQKVLNYQQYLKVFSTLNLAEPDGSDPNYSVTAKDFSAFLKVLYNGTFLSPEMSEKAMEIMLDCDFKKGMVEGLPSGTKIAHKFGEWSDGSKRHELHETGIVYLGSRPYLITIMTGGSDLEKIRKCIPILTQVTHRYLRQMNRQMSS